MSGMSAISGNNVSSFQSTKKTEENAKTEAKSEELKAEEAEFDKQEEEDLGANIDAEM